MERDLSDFITSDIVTDHEEQFALTDLLKCDYFKKTGRVTTQRETRATSIAIGTM